MGIELIAELATNHGGDLDLAKRLIDYAAKGGAHTVKTQAYRVESLNPADPQYDWLKQSALSERDHEALMQHAESVGVEYFASVFDADSARFIAELCGRVKYASTVKPFGFVLPATIYRSFPWETPDDRFTSEADVALVTVPMYPTPMEVLTRVEWGTGWSDHCEGIYGCVYAIARGATTVEVHVSIPGEGRNCVWDKTQDQLRDIRDWMETCQVIETGVSRTFRQRWVK